MLWDKFVVVLAVRRRTVILNMRKRIDFYSCIAQTGAPEKILNA
jgi:hypothetical protein